MALELFDIKSSVLTLSTAYLPNVEYMSYVMGRDALLVEVCETYPKQTYRNRCRIMTANGLLDLSVPVVRVNGNGTRTGDVRIAYDEDWQRVHWGALVSAYGASPYFMYYRDLLEPFYETKRYERLVDFNMDLLKVVMRILGMICAVDFTTDFVGKRTDGVDLRYAISPKLPSTMSGFGEYDQVYGHKFAFAGNLSVVDLIFNVGTEARLYIRELLKRMSHV